MNETNRQHTACFVKEIPSNDRWVMDAVDAAAGGIIGISLFMKQNLAFAFLYTALGVPLGRRRPLSLHRLASIANDRGARHEIEFGPSSQMLCDGEGRTMDSCVSLKMISIYRKKGLSGVLTGRCWCRTMSLSGRPHNATWV
jgi:hypothetical protein